MTEKSSSTNNIAIITLEKYLWMCRRHRCHCFCCHRMASTWTYTFYKFWGEYHMRWYSYYGYYWQRDAEYVCFIHILIGRQFNFMYVRCSYWIDTCHVYIWYSWSACDVEVRRGRRDHYNTLWCCFAWAFLYCTCTGGRKSLRTKHQCKL